MAQYPDEIYTPREKENRSGVTYDPNKKSVIFAEDIKKLDDEVVAIETELGTNPKGAFDSVKDFLQHLLSKVKDYFTDLLDTPNSYEGQAGKVLKVKETEDGLEFGDVSPGEVIQVSLINFIPSDNVRHSNDPEKKSTSLEYVKLKEIEILKNIPSVRVKYEYAVQQPGGWTGSFRLYKNDSPLGTEITTDRGYYQTASEDFSNFVVGDKIQVYAKKSEGATLVKVKNFRLCFDKEDIITHIGGRELDDPLGIVEDYSGYAQNTLE